MTDHLEGERTSSDLAHAVGCSRPGQVRLSKTSIAALEQCPKKLWLKLYQPHVARFSPATLRLFAAGHLVGELARREYPNGALVELDHHNLLAAIQVTRSLLEQPHSQPIFEAAFCHSNVVVRADILLPAEDGSWDLIEVKNSGGVRPAYISDLTTQAWVIEGSGVRLRGLYIRHPFKPLRPWGRAHPVHFTDVELGEVVKSGIAMKEDIVRRGAEVARGGMPVTRVGSHCSTPYRCEFFEYCRSSDTESNLRN